MRRFLYAWFFIFLVLVLVFIFVYPSERISVAQTIPQDTPMIYLPIVENSIPTPTEEPTRALTPTPLSLGVEVKSSTGFIQAGSKFYRVHGEVINKTASNAYRVRLGANFFDAAHNLVDGDVTEIFFGAAFPKQVVPFELLASKSINSITSYEIQIKR